MIDETDPHSAQMTLTPSDTDYGAAQTVPVSIADNDDASGITISQTTFNLTEGVLVLIQFV